MEIITELVCRVDANKDRVKIQGNLPASQAGELVDWGNGINARGERLFNLSHFDKVEAHDGRYMVAVDIVLRRHRSSGVRLMQDDLAELSTILRREIK